MSRFRRPPRPTASRDAGASDSTSLVSTARASLLDAVREGGLQAIAALRTAPWRAGLTMLGVAIGVFVVVVMAAVVSGINGAIAKDIQAAGPDSFFLYRRPVGIQACDGTEDTCPWIRNPAIKPEEADALRLLPEVGQVTIHLSSSVDVRAGDKRVPEVTLDGYSPEFLSTAGGTILAGRGFSSVEGRSGEAVVLVNQSLAEQLFPGRDPVGRTVMLDAKRFTIIGIYKAPAAFLGRPGQAGGGSGDPQAVVLIPAARQLGVPLTRLDVTVVPAPGVSGVVARDAVLVAMRAMRHLKPQQPNNFEIVTQELLVATYDRLFGTFFLVMLALSAVGLLVGGVGVIAVMSIAVTERTREIGIRKALGAPRLLILWQFLVEASALTLFGATGGLIVGGGVVWLVKTFSPLPAVIPLWAIGAALTSAVATGVVFGLIPAIRASRLDPVEALRYE